LALRCGAEAGLEYGASGRGIASGRMKTDHGPIEMLTRLVVEYA
jgi:hypothetical protein